MVARCSSLLPMLNSHPSEIMVSHKFTNGNFQLFGWGFVFRGWDYSNNQARWCPSVLAKVIDDQINVGKTMP